MRLESRLAAVVTVLATIAGTAATGAAAAAAAWTTPASFSADPPVPEDSNEGAPRVAVAADGAAVVAYRHTVVSGREQRSDLRAAAGRASGRFGPPALLARAPFSPPSVAVGAGGDRLVAWSSSRGLRAALFHDGRWVVRTLTSETRSAIDDVQVAADPRGCWVLVIKRFTGVSRVQALDLAADGRRRGPVQELGLGDFGNEARPVFALAVDGSGTAAFAYRDDAAFAPPPGVAAPFRPGVQVRVRRHGRRWQEPVGVPGVVDARVTPAPGGGAVLAATRFFRRGDVAQFGAPVSAVIGPDGTVGPLSGPALPQPGRGFTPSAVALAGGRRLLVGSLRATPAAFSPLASVAATILGPGDGVGAVRALTGGLASEPVAVPVAGRRAVVVWAGGRGWGTALASAGATLAVVRPPPGPPPVTVHFNATNRDVRSGGRWVAVAWERAGRVRVTFRRF